MISRFELFVAFRYLRARRKQSVISVITVISVMGVAAGVMALIIALGINNGFRGTLQRNLLGATAHINILEKEPSEGIGRWEALATKIHPIPHVLDVSPSLYGGVLLTGPRNSGEAILKGVDPTLALRQWDMLRTLKAGSLASLNNKDSLPGIVLGSRIAGRTGMMLGAKITVIVPNGESTPMGNRPLFLPFRVVGIFESGFYDFDNSWAFTSLATAQKIFGTGDVVNSLEVKIDEIYKAPEVAAQIESAVGDKRLVAATWMEQNRPILNALRTERIVTFITIGLIQLVGALNILTALVMAVMEKYRDIAILMSMGARREQIRNIFVLQGLLIGVVGVSLGLFLGYSLSYLADHYRWIRLDEEVYSLAYVPFDPRPLDAIWVAGIALMVSLLATLYPARNATRIVPVEALRYE